MATASTFAPDIFRRLQNSFRLSSDFPFTACTAHPVSQSKTTVKIFGHDKDGLCCLVAS
jgi:hypothetical protein